MGQLNWIGVIVMMSLFMMGCHSSKKMAYKAPKTLITPYEKDKAYSVTYQEAMAYYDQLAQQSKMVSVTKVGMTDSGEPLTTVVINKSQKFKPEEIKAEDKAILFINNGIHAGEPCGIDASMMLARDLVYDKKWDAVLDQIAVVIIPVYNIGGALNRGSFSRANQVGPKAYGFRGNAKNLDLNRDFIKGDSQNSRTFQRLFTYWAPDVFIDNHTSNGADYQYAITLLSTQKDKMSPPLSKYLTTTMLPELYAAMQKSGHEMTPYVFSRGLPDEGIYAFMDLPRFSSGYATLHNTVSLISEAHMLKPYQDRVEGVYQLMTHLLSNMANNKYDLLSAKKQAQDYVQSATSFPLDWSIDMSQVEKLTFKGYEATYRISEVTGQSRLYYDRSKPFTKEVPFYNTCQPTLTIQKPIAYIIPQAYREVIDRMVDNGVHVERLMQDSIISVEHYYIEDFDTTKDAYEGHYLHTNVKVRMVIQPWTYYKGDAIIYTNQRSNRYIIETLEPQAPDSWFAWNYFDGILGQKEYFSAYVFEDTAVELLKNDAELKKKFEAMKSSDKDFAGNANAQLDFIYKNSPYYERTHRLYPVGRILR